MLTEPKKRYSEEFYDCKCTVEYKWNSNFIIGVSKMRAITNKIVLDRKHSPPKEGGRLLIDEIIDIADSDQQINDLCLTYIVAGFHTTGNRTSLSIFSPTQLRFCYLISYLISVLTWMIYFLARYPDIQERVFDELVSVLGETEPLYSYQTNKLK